MKAQTQTLSIVLIAAIVIAMVGMAYSWGMPLIQKRITITEFSAAQNFILSLDKKITDIANSGIGEASIDIPNGFASVVGYGYPGADNNSILFEFKTGQPMMTSTYTVLIKTSSFGEVGTYGEAEPRIISITRKMSGSEYGMQMKLHYRELDTETKGYKIALNSISQSGERRVNIKFDKNVVQAGNATNGGDLILTYVDIELN